MIDLESITNKIICSDCMNILKQLPDKCIDLVLTDPPYGMNYQSGWREQKYEKIQDDNIGRYKNKKEAVDSRNKYILDHKLFEYPIQGFNQ